MTCEKSIPDETCICILKGLRSLEVKKKKRERELLNFDRLSGDFALFPYFCISTFLKGMHYFYHKI